MDRGKRKANYIILSDSSDEEKNDDWSEEEMSSDENSEWSSEEDDDYQSNPVHDDKALYDHIVQLLKGGHHLELLKLEECKVYLRKHGLRLTGTKEVCIQRIQEHWRIKDGMGEQLYPRSSFSINCTGDVCKCDVVVFTQRVLGSMYIRVSIIFVACEAFWCLMSDPKPVSFVLKLVISNRFDKVTRNGNLLGKRTIAGRVVKESYGAAKQQHTFTVEVLWSKGAKKMPPLAPLLVKGRILYRLKTFRQRWDNEAERSRVLAEKHKRGAAARELRATKKAYSSNNGSKRRMPSHNTGRSPKRHRYQEPELRTRAVTGKHGGGRGKVLPVNQRKMRNTDMHGVQRSFAADHFRSTQPKEGRGPVPHPYSLNSDHLQNHPRNATSAFDASRAAFFFSSNDEGSGSATMRMPAPKHHTYTAEVPIFQQDYNHTRFRHPHTAPSYHLDPMGLDYYQNQARFDRLIPSVPPGAEQYRRPTHGLLRCSAPGCVDMRSENCVVSSCWRCCRRTGRRCLWHQT
ncbi:hypothetical protein IFM89_032591 [Coptis chinensis]|uniref:SAP domain-containing protein n=1 Tax=Coptis chinensis TaxID=261450 RepID=A0A835IPC7_9MAGN|nr:hypothetical protein IFM89_032591 [Coptis chinensis]